MRSRFLALAFGGASVGSVLGCSLLVSTSDLTSSPDASLGDAAPPPGDGAPSADTATSDAQDGAPSVDAGDGAVAQRFCARAPHAFCEDFDDPGFVLPGRWVVVAKVGGAVDLESSSFSSAPRSVKFSLAGGGSETAAVLYADTSFVVTRGTFSFDANFSAAPNDNYNFCGLSFPTATPKTYDLLTLVTPSDLRYFEQSDLLFNDFVFNATVPSGWHHYAMAFDVDASTSSVAVDGMAATVHPIDSAFASGKLGIQVGINYARANAGPTSVLVDNVTLDVP